MCKTSNNRKIIMVRECLLIIIIASRQLILRRSSLRVSLTSLKGDVAATCLLWSATFSHLILSPVASRSCPRNYSIYGLLLSETRIFFVALRPKFTFFSYILIKCEVSWGSMKMMLNWGSKYLHCFAANTLRQQVATFYWNWLST